MITVDNRAVRLVSLHMNSTSEVIVRLLNVTMSFQHFRIGVNFPCQDISECNLDGTEIGIVSGTDEPIELAPNELFTLKLAASRST